MKSSSPFSSLMPLFSLTVSSSGLIESILNVRGLGGLHCRLCWNFLPCFKPFLAAKREEKPQGIKATSTFRRASKSYTGSATLKALLLYWKPHILENPLLAPKKENEMYIRVVAKADIYESSIKSTAIFKNPELWYDWKYRHAVKHMYSNVRATFNSLPSPLKVRDVPLA